jgi:holo-[acyl-carrier protein] synthase
LFIGKAILLIGIDMVDIERLRMVVTRTPRFLERVFTSGELQYCYAKSNPYPSLAARFAVKEAFRKLHPDFIRGVRFHDVETINLENGKPELILHGQALNQCQTHKITELSMSISHTDHQAVAVVAAMERMVP